MAPENTLENQLNSARQRVENMIQSARQLPAWQQDLLESPLRDFSQTLGSMQALAQEMSQREQELAERSLAQETEKQRYRKLFDLSPTGYLITNGEGLIWEANAAAARLLNVDQSTLNGNSVVDFIAAEEQSAFRARLAQLQSGRARQAADWALRLKPIPGRVQWAAVDVTAVQDEHNELIGLRWVLRDTTSQKLVEEALRKSEERYRRLLSSVTDYVYTVEIKNGRPVSTAHGPGCEAVTGYTPEEYAADPQLWLRMVHKGDQKTVLRQARRALSGEVYPLEHRIIHKAGSMRWVRNTPVPRYDDRNRLVAYDGLITDITDRVAARDAMQRTSQQFQDLVQSLDGIVWEADLPSFQYVYVSPQAERILGYPTEHWISQADFWKEHIYEPDRDWAVDFCVLQTKAMLDHAFEYRMVAADGRLVWLRDVVTVVSEQGQPVKLRGVMVDITQNKHADEEMRESEEKYRTLFEASTDAIFVETLDNQILDCNASATELYGYSKEEMLKLNVQDLVPDAIRQALPAINLQIIAEGRVFLLAENVRKNGEVFPCEVNIVTTHIGGQPRVITYVRDITKRKLAEQALQEAQAVLEQRVEERTAELRVTVGMLEREIEGRQRIELALEESQHFLQLILDCLPTPMFYKDRDGRFLGCNQAFEKYIGFPRHNIIGKKVTDLAPLDLAQEYTAADEALFVELSEQVYESLVQGPDGVRRDVIFNKAPFFNPDGSVGGLVGSIFDITARKRMESYMMRTERLAAMGSVAAALAHEIKNPLQTVQSNVELVLDYGLEPEEREEYLRLCYREIERLIEITNRLLNLALPSQSAFQLNSVPALVQHTLALVARQLEQARIQVITKIAPDLPEGPVPEQIVEVLLNLIINAIEALPEGGDIRIEANCDTDSIYLAVTNSGVGIAPEHLDQIFEPFFTTKPHGTGLGLPISHNIVQQLGGTLTAENLSQGVRFTIALPAAITHELDDSAEMDDLDSGI